MNLNHFRQQHLVIEADIYKLIRELEQASDLLERVRAEILQMQQARPDWIEDTANDKAIDKFLAQR